MEILYIDDREHKCILSSVKELYPKVSYEIKRLLLGDFVLYKDGVQAIFERKTWDDLASSIKDGRKNNIQKLKEFQKESNCKLFYIIEGISSPFHQNISIFNLQAHLNHLIWRDNIHILYSSSIEDTLHQIFKFFIHLQTLKTETKKHSVHWISKLTPQQVHAKMISCIKGITYDTALYWVEEHQITLKHFINKTIPSLHYKTGRCVSNIEKIYTFIDSHLDTLYVEWMQCIPLIGKKKSSKYCSEISLEDIFERPDTIKQQEIVKYFIL